MGKTRLVHDWITSIAGADVQSYVVCADPLYIQVPHHLISSLFERLAQADPEPKFPVNAGADTAAVAQHLLSRCYGRPTLFVIDDLHWADSSSLDVLDAVADQLAHRQILMVMTSRLPVQQAAERTRLRQISLAPLTETQTQKLVASVVGRSLTAQARDQVVSRSGGIPLFAEELARLVHSTPSTATSRVIPKTLDGLLLARLTMLGPAMALAQCAAILGIEMSVAALEALAGRRRLDLVEGLQALDRANVAVVSGEPAKLRFRHALYRDAALETLLSADRKSLYRDAAELFDASDSGIVPDAALAEFWREAGEHELALDAFDRAIGKARSQRGWREVGQLVETMLAQLRTTTRGKSGVKRELGLQTLLAEALQITSGYSSPAARAAAAEAQRLAERIGEIDQSMMSVAGKWMAASSAGSYREARLVADQALMLAQLHGGADALAAAHMIDMTTRYRMGDLVGAEAAFRSGSDFFNAPAFLGRAGAIPQTFGNAALIALLKGDSIAARQRSAYALRAARRQNSAYDCCFAAYMVAMVEILLGADRKAVVLGARALRLAEALGFPQFEAIARIVIGRARAGMGEVDAGIMLLREGLAAMGGTYSRNAQTLYLTWLAEAALLGGDVDAALETTDAACEINAEEAFYRPETLRIRSLALLRQGAVAEAGALLLEAEALAEAMQAPWFTVRMTPLKIRLGLR